MDYSGALLLSKEGFVYSIVTVIAVCMTVLTTTVVFSSKKVPTMSIFLQMMIGILAYQFFSLLVLYSPPELKSQLNLIKDSILVIACFLMLMFLLTVFNIKLSKNFIAILYLLSFFFIIAMLYNINGPQYKENYLLNMICNITFIFMDILLFYKYSFIFDRKLQVLSRVEVIQGTDELVVFLDEKNIVRYIHNGTDIEELPEKIHEITEDIRKQKNEALIQGKKVGGIRCDGEIKMTFDMERVLKYKSIWFFENSVFTGTLLLLRDVTKLTDILRELGQKNRMLKQAFEKQKEYVKIEQKLLSENERAKILQSINMIAREYLKEIKMRISRIKEKSSDADEEFLSILVQQSMGILDMTKATTQHVRETVYNLRLKN